jgi:uncharacterized protein (TIGR03435 family)
VIVAKQIYVAIVGPLCLGVLIAGNSFSQTAARLEFEAASVKPSASARLMGTMVRDGKFTATGIGLKALLALAYDVRESEILDGSNPVGSDRYDINAKAAGPVNTAELKLMIRTLLEDRFQLRTHRETKQMPVYALITERSGPKLKPSNDVNCTDPSVYTPPPQLPTPGQPFKPVSIRCGNFYVLNDRLQGRTVTLQQFAAILSSMNLVQQRVVDQTGINGTFDFDLEWDASQGRSAHSADSPSEPQAPADNLGATPDLFTAFQQQLGLRLTSTKAPVDMLAIDKVEKPSAN